MITPTSSTGRAAQARAKQLSIESAALLRAALVHHPEIRPEFVARARAIVADPEYPPRSVMRFVAQQILAAPDVSEDRS